MYFTSLPRHSFSTHLLKKRNSRQFYTALLGHNDVETTMKYAKVAQKDLKKIAFRVRL
ncbi:MAG: tyrosine-type recombinase/integrase [Dysgonamonadaceae bacterium]|nr:tyrosine-type recombinase/integrase [Dysgonamonadaceae bacterium]